MFGSQNRKFHKIQSNIFKAANPPFLEAKETLVIKAVNLIQSDQFHGTLAIPPSIYDYETNPYSNRILDALARIFYIKENGNLRCCAVSLGKKDGGGKIYVSYNSEPDQHIQDSVKLLFQKTREYAASDTYKPLVTYCLTENHYFYCQEYKWHTYLTTRDTDKKSTPQNLKTAIHEIIDEFKSKGYAFDNDKKKVCLNSVVCYSKKLCDLSPKSFEDLVTTKAAILADEAELINKFKEAMGPEESSEFKEIADIIDTVVQRKLYFWDRLVHDCTKIVKYFKASVFASMESAEDIYFVPNPNPKSKHCTPNAPKGTHCELNILAEQKKDGYSSYVGISKPSCFTCDIQFRIDEERLGGKILHAGGSGIVYPIDAIPHIFLGPYGSLFDHIMARAHQVTDGSTDRKLDPAVQYQERFSPLIEDMILAGAVVQSASE